MLMQRALCRPSSIGLLMGALLSRRVSQGAVVPELLYLGMRAEHQQKGLGRLLMSRFEECLVEAGHEAYELCIVANNNDARRFYQRVGAEFVGHFQIAEIHYESFRRHLGHAVKQSPSVRPERAESRFTPTSLRPDKTIFSERLVVEEKGALSSHAMKS